MDALSDPLFHINHLPIYNNNAEFNPRITNILIFIVTRLYRPAGVLNIIHIALIG
jgi:hypothetical protein